MTTPKQRAQTDRWKSRTPIYKISHHDRVVYRIAEKELKKGCDKILIGPHIESASRMVRLLQKRYPEAIIGIHKIPINIKICQ